MTLLGSWRQHLARLLAFAMGLAKGSARAQEDEALKAFNADLGKAVGIGSGSRKPFPNDYFYWRIYRDPISRTVLIGTLTKLENNELAHQQVAARMKAVHVPHDGVAHPTEPGVRVFAVCRDVTWF